MESVCRVCGGKDVGSFLPIPTCRCKGYAVEPLAIETALRDIKSRKGIKPCNRCGFDAKEGPMCPSCEKYMG